jgi:hypothetical protein
VDDEFYRWAIVDTQVTTGLSEETFACDGVGNRELSVETVADWTYNPNNELVSK